MHKRLKFFIKPLKQKIVLKPKPKRFNIIVFPEDLVAADIVAASYLGII
ncbi:MAG: hypothetical protein QXL69_03415 [Candidatus Bathyarchaeia archaeon]|nr:hypothetical protein [Candidatus Bathyarchaeota archaeon]